MHLGTFMFLEELETQYFSFFLNSKANDLGRSGQVCVSALLAFHERTALIGGYGEIFGSRMIISFPCAKPRSRNWFLRGVFKGILGFSMGLQNLTKEQKKYQRRLGKRYILNHHFTLSC